MPLSILKTNDTDFFAPEFKQAIGAASYRFRYNDSVGITPSLGARLRHLWRYLFPQNKMVGVVVDPSANLFAEKG